MQPKSIICAPWAKSESIFAKSAFSEILGKSEPSEILPEYYVIKVNQFDDIAKDNLDQWIYYLKNNDKRLLYLE